MSDPAAEIATLENLLRALIREVLGDGQPWADLVDVAELRRRQVEEGKRRAGAVVSEDLLDYMHLTQLHKIIDRHWPSFKPALGEQKDWKVDIERVEEVRNAPMHGRALLPFERDLLAGIVGGLRNRVSRYRVGTSPDNLHYPAFESITDSFGHRLTRPAHDASAELNMLDTTKSVRLAVGDVVTFECRGSDAQGRPLSWWLHPKGERVVGDQAVLSWTATEAHIAGKRSVNIAMASPGPYHRRAQADHDFYAMFLYAVDPPLPPAAPQES